MKLVKLTHNELFDIIREYLNEETDKSASKEWWKSKEGKRYRKFLYHLEQATLKAL